MTSSRCWDSVIQRSDPSSPFLQGSRSVRKIRMWASVASSQCSELPTKG